MFGEHDVVRECALPKRSTHSRIARVGDIAEGNDGVAAQMAGIASGDVPTSMTGKKLLIIGGQQLEEIDLRTSCVDHECGLR